MRFEIVSEQKPAGGQPEAIERLVRGYAKHPRQTLLGITGSGKTFVMAHLIERVQKPTLVLAHNKTLAAQLYAEFKELFPKNKVEYFISYYDYYQPESYLPTSDTYIEKEATVNEQIERMRLKATASLLSREDTIIVASISCIYGLGNPNDYWQLSLPLEKGTHISRMKIIETLIEMQYERTTGSLEQGMFRVRGDVIDVLPAYDEQVLRIELFGDEIDRISELHAVTRETISEIDRTRLFPSKHYVVPYEKHERALKAIREELAQRLPSLGELEAQRLRQRVKYDLEMIEEIGYCTGIENYSRHFDGRQPGEPPYVLLDYFPKDFLMIIDESHQSIPQARAMYHGDRSRKKNLVDFGFRLPSAYDNRPLTFEEFEGYLNHTVFVSATPGPYELERSGDITELIIRPTGLVDPIIEHKPAQDQIPDLLTEIETVLARNERILITTLTKRMAEDLTNYLAQKDVKVRYLHSDIESLDRIELIRQLRAGEFDVLVGINLLREGLDLPEVSLVAILDADQEGFLRDERSLIQTIGRAARNVNGKVVLYAQRETESMRRAIELTRERRRKQIAFNREHGIEPQTIRKRITAKQREITSTRHLPKKELQEQIAHIDAEMRRAAESLDFERAIELRDTLAAMQREESA